MTDLRALVFALVLPFAPAQAALISTDSDLGPGTTITDTDTGLEWLKLSATRNLSINQVFAAIEPGGSLNGFRYATGSEFPSGFRFSPGNADAARVESFFSLFGIAPLFPGFDPDGVITFANVDPPDSPDVREGLVRTFVLRTEPTRSVEVDSQIIPVARALDEPALHWLVRSAQAVPEPSTSAVLGLGLVGMILMRIKRQR